MPAPLAAPERVFRALAVRTAVADHDAFVPAVVPADNGDEARYADKCATYTKGVLQTGIGLVDLAAYATFRRALASGDPADFEGITLGGTRTLNGPQGGLAFDLESLDASQFLVPPAPTLDSETYATELVELYWAARLRDVAFTDYVGNPTANDAATELSTLSAYQGPRDMSNQVTPNLLFRGGFVGETVGPYLSQFLLRDARFGALPIVQRYATLKAGVDYMTDSLTFQQVQNGISTGLPLQFQPPVYLHDGRGLGAYTHDDVLYQAYFTAYLVLNAINGGASVPLNPGNPYHASLTQNGFNTFGQPDIAGLVASVAAQALKAVWYQKWYVHLRHRPESGGAIVHLQKTGLGSTIEGQLSPIVLNSHAVQASHMTTGSYFLPQAFPEGSPTHPAYPTGHGTVAGACITALKFFYDGNFVIPAPKKPNGTGTALVDYTDADAGDMTVNGELNKLAHNISFGHGIHAGIHWRSDTDTSIRLGEAVALSVLRDRASTYNEKFTVRLQKLDGTTATISNE
ncbi:MAG TPA: vanadium-dependent haloperoxidase [Gemmatirosa sp.]